MAPKTLLLLFGIFLLLLAIHELDQVDALRFLPQQTQEAQEGDASAMKESFVQQIQSQNLPVGKALMYSKPSMVMPEAGVEALDANKKADLACEEKKKKPKCGEKKKPKCGEKKPKKKPSCGGGNGEEAITD